MNILVILFCVLHPYFKQDLNLVDSVYFYKDKINLILKTRKTSDFPLENRDSLLIFKNIMFREIKENKRQKKYYNYVIKRDRFMYLIYLFKKGDYEKIYNILNAENTRGPEEYIIYMLACLKLKKSPEFLLSGKFASSEYYPYILYLNSLFLFIKNEYKAVFENLTDLNYEPLNEDIDFLKALVFFNRFKNPEEMEKYIDTYKENFYTDTLCFLTGSYYYSIKKYRNAENYIRKLAEKEGKFYKFSLEMLIEIESLIGERTIKLLEVYKEKFKEGERFRELVRRSILNLYSRRKFEQVIEIYNNWGEIIKSKIFAAYIGALLRVEKERKAFRVISMEEDRFLKGIGYFKVAENYEIKGSYWNAIKFYNRALKYLEQKSEFSQSIFLKKLLLEVKVGRIPNLKIAYKIFLKKFPGTEKKLQILKEMVSYLLKERKFGEALVYQKQVFEIENKRENFEKLANIAYNIKNKSIVDSLYLNAGDEFKDIAGFYKGLLLYKVEKDPFSALEVFKEIPETESKSEYVEGAKYYVGEIYKSLGKIQESENILIDLIQSEDTISFKSILLLADIFKEKGNLNEMEELLVKISLRWEDEKRGHILFRLAEVKEIKREIEDAKNLYLLSADFLFPSLDSLSLALYRAANLTDLREEKKALLERAKSMARTPLLKKEIEKSLIDLE